MNIYFLCYTLKNYQSPDAQQTSPLDIKDVKSALLSVYFQLPGKRQQQFKRLFFTLTIFYVTELQDGWTDFVVFLCIQLIYKMI